MINESARRVFEETLITGDFGKAIENQEKRSQLALQESSRLPIKCGARINSEKYFEKLKNMGIQIINEKVDDLFMKVLLPKGWKIKPTDHSMWSHLVDDRGRERASIFYKGAFYDRDAFINFNRRFNISCEKPDYDEKLFEQQPEYLTVGYKKVVESSSDEYEWDCYDGYVCDINGEFFIKPKKTAVKQPILEKNPNYKPLTGYEKYSQPFHFEVYDFDGTIIFKSEVVRTDFEYSQDKHWEFFENRDIIIEWAKFQCEVWLNHNYPGWKDDLAYWNL